MVEYRRPNSERQLTAGLTAQHHFKGVTRMAKISIGELLFKRCVRCDTLKAIVEFRFVRCAYFGSYCRDCMNAYGRVWYAGNRDKAVASKARYKAKHPLIPKPRKKRTTEEKRDYQRRWASAKRNKNEENKEKARRVYRDWAKKNPEVVYLNTTNRQARKRGAEGKYSIKDVRLALESQKGRCGNLNCLKTLKKYHIDHIVPIARGGTNWPDNIQLLCPPCNMAKHAKMPDIWAKDNGLLFT